MASRCCRLRPTAWNRITAVSSRWTHSSSYKPPASLSPSPSDDPSPSYDVTALTQKPFRDVDELLQQKLLSMDVHSPPGTDSWLYDAVDNVEISTASEQARAVFRARNSQYHETRAERRNIPRRRSQTDPLQYAEFLRWLYPPESLKSQAQTLQKLRQAYRGLANSERPLYIEADHLESLLSTLLGHHAMYGLSDMSGFAAELQEEMRRCGMPLTVREEMAALHLRGKSIVREVMSPGMAGSDQRRKLLRRFYTVVESMFDLLSEETQRDVALYNMLLHVATLYGKDSLVTEVLELMSQHGVEMNAASESTLVRYYGHKRRREDVETMLKAYMQRTELFEIRPLNEYMAALLNVGNVPLAQKLLQLVEAKANEELAGGFLRFQRNRVESLLEKRQREYLQSPRGFHSPFQAPVFPNYQTYRAFLRYYCFRRGTPFAEVVALISSMKSFQIAVTDSFYYLLVNGFQRNYQDAELGWTLPRMLRFLRVLMAEAVMEDSQIHPYLFSEQFWSAVYEVTQGLTEDGNDECSEYLNRLSAYNERIQDFADSQQHPRTAQFADFMAKLVKEAVQELIDHPVHKR